MTLPRHLVTVWNASYASDHMPSYYRDQFADFWFQLWDIRRLVADDTPAVIEELKRLRNTRYHDRPVSLYGGMVELPLIVTREDGASWFSDRDVLTDGQLWAQRESELRGETERMARELHDTLAHSLSAVTVQLEAVRSLWEINPEQALGMLLFMIGRFFKDLGYLHVPFFLGLGREVGVAIAGLRFSCK